MPRLKRHLPATPQGERDRIRALALRAGRSRHLRIGIGDDCAVLRVPPGAELAVTTDLLLETIHFRRDWHSPESAGHRCLARGLSDLAATGAQPLAAFLSLAIPRDLARGWSDRFLDGLLALAAAHGVPLAGGDTAEAPAIEGRALFSADITLLGAVPRGRALLRAGARAGDRIYVTGALGGAAAELALLAARPSRYLRLRTAVPNHPQLFPEPRLAQGRALRRLATAAIDLSDGLSTDLHHLCEASGLRAELEVACIPVHPLALASEDSQLLALHGGEDYELLFTARPGTRVPRSVAGIPTTAIGRMVPRRAKSPAVLLISPGSTRTPLHAGGWEHFRSRPQGRRS